jgi:hypothetical protein
MGFGRLMWVIVAIVGLGVALVAGKKAVQTTQLTVSDGIKAVAEAIARAEGFYVAGSEPARANNPGDLKIGDRGYGVIFGKTIFATPEDGWNALYRQLILIRNGKSRNFKPTDTWRAVAQTWVGPSGSEDWLKNVTNRLGAKEMDSIGGFLA